VALAQARAVAVRTREGADLGSMTLERFVELLDERVSQRSRVMNDN
jgi:threonyl-tRNA synthetase